VGEGNVSLTLKNIMATTTTDIVQVDKAQVQGRKVPLFDDLSAPVRR
jgi:hypothetical protein